MTSPSSSHEHAHAENTKHDVSPRKNVFFILFGLITGFTLSFFGSIRLFFVSLFSSNARPLRENEFLKVMDFTLNAGPRSFWRFPTAIKIGRSIATFLSFVFDRNRAFTIKKTHTQKKGFTLIELLASITIIAIVVLVAYATLQHVSISWFVVSGRADLNRDLYYATEKIVSLVKEGGSIDYEEYWDRSSIGTTTSSGHYVGFTGFGNFGSGGDVGTANYGDGFYLCRSASGVSMTHTGCLENEFNTYSGSVKGQPQRYGEYALQFFDYNGDANGDWGDEKWVGKIYGDSDNLNLFKGPTAFESGVSQPELYLINKQTFPQERTYLRRVFDRDPDAPASVLCDASSSTGCLARLQILRLVGRDLGMAHTGSTTVTSTWRTDGIVDTWVCASDFICSWPDNMPLASDIVSATGAWVDLFPRSINVKKLEFYLFPNKDPNFAVDEVVAPSAGYVRLALSVGYSWAERRKFALSDPTITISTTLNLSGR